MVGREEWMVGRGGEGEDGRGGKEGDVGRGREE